MEIEQNIISKKLGMRSEELGILRKIFTTEGNSEYHRVTRRKKKMEKEKWFPLSPLRVLCVLLLYSVVNSSIQTVLGKGEFYIK